MRERGTLMTKRLLYFFLLLSAINPLSLLARNIEPFVSTDWLDKNSGAPGLLIIDVRSAADYKKSHIPGALNAGVNSWTVNKNGLLRELPASAELIALMGSLGIKEDSRIVIIGNGATDFDRADAIRVAWTVLTTGVRNVSVLDGGYAKWIKDKKPTASDQSTPLAGEYKGKFNEAVVVSKKYVLSKIGKSILVDTRAPDIYFGITTESWAQKPGHIESAVNIPTPWLFTKEGLLRSRSDLESMASGVIGTNKSKEYIIYCGVGPYAMVWSYIMTEMLGYKDVKVYDGSMQEWVMDPIGPISIFTWR
jgi:thiosulfate/3-mercaptopyruvate sulfurtransferase